MGRQPALPFAIAPRAAPRVLGACGHCGAPATQATLASNVVCCADCWAATLRGEVVRRCAVCGGGERKHRGCHGCRGRGVVYVPRDEPEHG